MTITEIATLVKAGYVIVAPAGQSYTNLKVLSEIFQTIIPAITPEIVKTGEAMSMQTMVNNLENFRPPHEEATALLEILGRVFCEGKSVRYAAELQKLLRQKKYSPFEMPLLAAGIKADFKVDEIYSRNNNLIFQPQKPIANSQYSNRSEVHKKPTLSKFEIWLNKSIIVKIVGLTIFLLCFYLAIMDFKDFLVSIFK